MTTNKNKQVVLLSGGLDSVANLAIAKEEGNVVLTLTANYGQRAYTQELKAAKKFSEFYGVPNRVVDLTWLSTVSKSALTKKEREMPHPEKKDLDHAVKSKETAKAVWVSNRNGVLINVAAAFAEMEAAKEVLVGFNVEEAATFPDNSEAFGKAITESLFFSTANQVLVKSYTSRLNKNEIVERLKGLKTPLPFNWLWSCYENDATLCGKCESCMRFERCGALALYSKLAR